MANKYGSAGNQQSSNISHANDGLSSQLLQKGLTSANLQGALRPAPASSASNQPTAPAQAPAASSNSSKKEA